jgi:hypothetical protein
MAHSNERMDIPKELRESGLKATLPRLRILQLFHESKTKHLSAEDVYRLLQDERIDVGPKPVVQPPIMTAIMEAPAPFVAPGPVPSPFRRLRRRPPQVLQQFLRRPRRSFRPASTPTTDTRRNGGHRVGPFTLGSRSTHCTVCLNAGMRAAVGYPDVERVLRSYKGRVSHALRRAPVSLWKSRPFAVAAIKPARMT